MDEAKRKLSEDELFDFLATAPGRLPEDDWCFWCGKERAKVARLVVGPVASICDQCVELCVEILAELIREENPPNG